MNLPPSDLQRLLAQEPFVRALATSLLADEADDVVQQAYLRAIEQRPGSVREPRSWLARVVRNLVADRRRHRSRRQEREDVLEPHPLVPSSAELAVTEERRRELVGAVDALPEHLRTVVLLRWFEGLPPRRIAQQLMLPVSTVWNRLHAALVALRKHLDAEHSGDRRAWLVPLVPFAVSPRGLPWREIAGSGAATGLSLGAIAMTSKMKVAVAIAAVLILATLWAGWPPPGRPVPPPGLGVRGTAVTTNLEPPRAEVPAPEPAAAREAAATPAVSPRPAAGELELVVRYDDEPHPAAGVPVHVTAAGGDFRMERLRALTDSEGLVRFPGLAPGQFVASVLVRSGGAARVDVQAGVVTRRELRLQRGFRLEGIVVDGSGAAVGGALIESVPAATSGVDAEEVARSAADGTFVLRQCQPYLLVGARAHGFAASQLYFLNGDDGKVQQLRIELRQAGGSVEGAVVGPDARPVVGAVVRVGDGQTDGMPSTAQGAPPLPAQVRTDAAGRFLAIGVPPGSQPVMVRSPDFAPWRGASDVVAGATTAVRVLLSPGVTCRGHVRDEAGEPLAGVKVGVGGRGEFVQFTAETAVDGAFVLRGLPANEVELVATKPKVGKANARVRGEPGTEVRCDLTLSQGIVLRGRVVDEAGAPVAKAMVMGEAVGNGPYWRTRATTDAEGRFVVVECPAGRTLTITAAAPGRITVTRSDLRPGGDETVLQLPRETAPRARLVGRLLRPDGTGAVGERIEPYRADPRQNLGEDFDAVVKSADGAFTIAVPPGRWTVRIMVKDHPTIRFDDLELAAGAVHDFGVLQIVRGGTLVVRDDPAAKREYLVFDSADQFVCGLWSTAPPLRSELLAPRDYRLLVRGAGIAATAIPFTIRAGGETSLQVRPGAGVRVQFMFVPPAADERPRSVGFDVRRDGQLVALGRAGSGAADLTGEIWLAPGKYELLTRERQPATTFPFTVAEAPGVPLRIALR